ncbi:MAG: NUDIX domain-containing protein [Candidatus Buchananbacteria bacterium]|jgi:ADP-ribose pyrophosphatase YjhB (NUDIX family)
MLISEKTTFAGRDLTLTWQEAENIPVGKNISQVSAFCLDNEDKVLIIKNKHGWGLPGGHPESGETLEESLKREIMEEADCSIKDFKLIGYVEVNDPNNDSIEGREYFQLRFFCRLSDIGEFRAEFETSERNFVSPAELPEYIEWMKSSVTGQAQIESFIRFFERNRL